MARTLEELIILKRTALRYLLARESRLLALGKKPVNKKIANFVKCHQEDSVWSSFLNSLHEDLTRNLNIYEWKLVNECGHSNARLSYRLDSVSRATLKSYDVLLVGGRMTEAPIVTVEQGKLQGRVASSPSGKEYFSFQGIPYAKPPLGSLRFKDPQPVEPWEGVREATAEGNVSAQIDQIIHKDFIGDENCLFLNVYTPNLDGEFLPVMVFIHGGGFNNGSGNSSLYGPEYLVERDVIIVTINYRCGALGFLCLNTPEIPGNAGLKDMALALNWVKENIQNFGGNSGNITIFGESAGGVAVSLLTGSPLTKNLINKAIIQSGTGLNSWTLQDRPLENAKALAKILGCESEDFDEIKEFLTTTPVREIVDANRKLQPAGGYFEKGNHICAPVIEKIFPGVEAALTEPFIDILTSGRTAQVPIMIGSTTLEFSFEKSTDDFQVFIPEDFKLERNSEESIAVAEKIKRLYFKDGHVGVENLNEYFELLSDKLINIDTHRYVKYLVQASNKPIYYYKFDYVGELNLSKKLLTNLGLKHAAHMDELGYLFTNVLQKDVEPTSQDIKMRERMLRLWTNFAKGGNPTPEENHFITVTWLPVTKENLYYLNLGSELSLGTSPDKEKMEFWEELYSKYFKIWEHPVDNQDGVPEKVVPVSAVEVKVEDSEVMVEDSEKVEENEVIVDETDAVEVVAESNGAVGDAVSVVEEIQEAVKVTDEEMKVADEVKVSEEIRVVEEVDKVIAEAETVQIEEVKQNGNSKVEFNGNGHHEEPVKPRTSNEIKMAGQNGVAKDVIRANDPPEDDLPKNIGVNKFVNFFESLGGKKK